jgi:hypothetical protein
MCFYDIISHIFIELLFILQRGIENCGREKILKPLHAAISKGDTG